ncbi:hypothetical protein [Arthrobacter sp. zg-Y1110]|uniref:hypothetical protein n=1 Tax=Arthrobacter sp. zg-Y1110 TaxID=2886932 RepID=UPI001D138061|nr:hypothetical protein [Arthrobacter sp. zg-Y1110]MCC3292959.1 hypothetical protein [Arthrobacter sp. zg-Y1110]UWX86898.1 hypothetical protein N2K99_18820 [Arthrobacter sp. zg-Y1110]
MTETPGIADTIFSVFGPAVLWGIGAVFGLGIAVSGVKMIFARMVDKDQQVWPKGWLHLAFMAVGATLVLVCGPQLSEHMSKAFSGQVTGSAAAEGTSAEAAIAEPTTEQKE